jgi:pyruvate/2-oxoglutarate dehydrogenase complex dihydrolipoamide dehydrogenase (E3) component
LLAEPAAGGPVVEVEADVILLATGARPRVLPSAVPDRERILAWRPRCDLPALPERLVVIGSGVTGGEFANAYRALGSHVALVFSRPGAAGRGLGTDRWPAARRRVIACAIEEVGP